MGKEEILAFLRSNKHIFKDHFQVEKIGLFGSYVKGNQRVGSDIDILVDMPSSFDAYYDFKEYLEENLQRNVDLGLIKNVREHLKDSILDEVIYV